MMIKIYKNIPFSKQEALRYAGVKKEAADMLKLLDEVYKEAKDKISFKVCYDELEATFENKKTDFGAFEIISADLKKALEKSERVIVFGATLGAELDRLIIRYSALSPLKAVMLQGIGASLIEALCDEFSKDIEKEKKRNITRRFSPGYGDLDIENQKKIFDYLNLSKNIGLTLTESFMMSPTKSVTAFFGITDEALCEKENKCSLCKNKDCEFRK